MSEYKDWCEVPKVVMTGHGWCVRINGCDVFDPINQHGCKGLRSFDIVKGLDSKEAAEAFRIQWLREQLPGADAQSGLAASKYKAELYDEVWQLAKDAGFENVTMVFDELAALREELAVAEHEIKNRISAEVGAIEALQAAEQRNETLAKAATEFMEYAECGWDHFPDVGVTLRAVLAVKNAED
jgi:hypothetical protein